MRSWPSRAPLKTVDRQIHSLIPSSWVYENRRDRCLVLKSSSLQELFKYPLPPAQSMWPIRREVTHCIVSTLLRATYDLVSLGILLANFAGEERIIGLRLSNSLIGQRSAIYPKCPGARDEEVAHGLEDGCARGDSSVRETRVGWPNDARTCASCLNLCAQAAMYPLCFIASSLPPTFHIHAVVKPIGLPRLLDEQQLVRPSHAR